MVIKEIRFECPVHPWVNFSLKGHADNALLQLSDLITLEDIWGLKVEMRTSLVRRSRAISRKKIGPKKILFILVDFIFVEPAVRDGRRKRDIDYIIKILWDRLEDLLVCASISHLCSFKILPMRANINGVYYGDMPGFGTLLSEWHDFLLEYFGEYPLVHVELSSLWDKYKEILFDGSYEDDLVFSAIKYYKALFRGDDDNIILIMGYSMMVLEALCGLPDRAIKWKLRDMMMRFLPTYPFLTDRIVQLYNIRSKLLHGHPIPRESYEYEFMDGSVEIMAGDSQEPTHFSCLAAFFASVALQKTLHA